MFGSSFHGRNEAGVGDYVLMRSIDMNSFVENTKVRHANGNIYTFIGEVCVNVNPYKELPIYGQDYVNQVIN